MAFPILKQNLYKNGKSRITQLQTEFDTTFITLFILHTNHHSTLSSMPKPYTNKNKQTPDRALLPHRYLH